jgi:hypothetical protein
LTSAAQIYDEAASVRQQTGVDPAIIATIAQTESDLSKSPWTLGITHGATRGGAGAAGTWIPSGNTYGGTQPAGFWSYTNGADAAMAFANYIRAYQSALVPLLNNALAFFNPSGPIFSSNYYVPTPGEISQYGGYGAATTRYYQRWANMASQFPHDPLAAGAVGEWQAGQMIAAGANASAQRGYNPFPGVHIPFGLLWAVLFFVAAAAAIAVGVWLVFQPQVTGAVRKVAAAAAA